MKRLLGVALLAAAIALPLAVSAQPSGQVQSIAPMTRDLGSIKTLAAVGPSTVTSADQNGFNVSRVVCVYRQSAHTGTSSTTFKIQNKDAASGQYYDVIVSAAVAADSVNPIAAGAGLANVTNSTAAFPIAKTWRVSLTESGGGSTVTGTVGCSVQ